MPIFNTRVEGEARDQQGNVIRVPPRMALQQIGPSVPVILSPLEAHLKAIIDKGGSPPPPVSGRALILKFCNLACLS